MRTRICALNSLAKKEYTLEPAKRSSSGMHSIAGKIPREIAGCGRARILLTQGAPIHQPDLTYGEMYSGLRGERPNIEFITFFPTFTAKRPESARVVPALNAEQTNIVPAFSERIREERSSVIW